MSLESLNASYEKLFNELASLSQEELKASQGKTPAGRARWSYLELAEHLVNAPFLVLGGLKEKNQLIAKESSVKSRLIFWIVLLILRTGVRVPVPDKAMKPSGHKDLETIRQEWKAIYSWLKHFEKSASDEEQRARYFAHPVSGPLNFREFLILAKVHFASHRRKMKPIGERG